MSDAAPQRLLTPEEVAERLHLSPVTVGHMLRAGKLPGVKVLRLWRIREAALDEYIRGLEAPAPTEAQAKNRNAADKANATRGPAGRSEASRKANATRKARAKGDGS